MARRFRVALSFAGEVRDYVDKLARILAQQLGEVAILYDKFHESELARHDLGIYLPRLYGEQSDLIVPVFSPDYNAKRWTGWEWLHIHGLLTRGDGHRVMPCRFGYATVDGLSAVAAFVELDGKTPEHASRLILERLALNEGHAKEFYAKPADGTPRAPAAIPNNLPRPLPLFGREAELKKLAEALGPDARGWGALIDGPGGIGKTSLAVRAAELLPAGRFQRIIFLSSKERELTADGQRALGHFLLPTYLEMMNAIAREIGQPDLTKSPETERTEGVLHALRQADVLLVLDNLETLPEPDRDQVFAFLNRLPRGSSAIVTSRRRADASALTLRLDKLDWAAAAQLLASLADHNARLREAGEPERRALYDETGGNPLLMRWVVGQLGLGRCRTIAAALAFLRTAPASNNPLEFVFGDLLDTFTPNETKVLSALTHFTLPMTPQIIAELAGVNAAAAEGALTDLAARALVLPDLEERQFALVPMVADFLRRTRPEAVAETGNRLESWVYALVVENGYRKYDRFQALEEAWPMIAAALPRFVAGPNDRLQTVCDALQTFYDFSGRSDEKLALARMAEGKASAAGDFAKAGWRACDAGYVAGRRGVSEDVMACADRVDAHWSKAQIGSRERAVALDLRGSAHMLANQVSAAISVLREAVALDRATGESDVLADHLGFLADLERRAGDLDAAERNLGEARRIARERKDASVIQYLTHASGNLAIARDDARNAEALFREALAMAEKLGNQYSMAHCHVELAHALVKQNRTSEARPHAQRGLEMQTALGGDVARARYVLAQCDK